MRHPLPDLLLYNQQAIHCSKVAQSKEEKYFRPSVLDDLRLVSDMRLCEI